MCEISLKIEGGEKKTRAKSRSNKKFLHSSSPTKADSKKTTDVDSYLSFELVRNCKIAYTNKKVIK